MNALQDFFTLIDLQESQSELQVYSSKCIRREMFKLRYLTGAFELNREADAFEALDYLLTCIHTWS